MIRNRITPVLASLALAAGLVMLAPTPTAQAVPLSTTCTDIFWPDGTPNGKVCVVTGLPRLGEKRAVLRAIPVVPRHAKLPVRHYSF